MDRDLLKLKGAAAHCVRNKGRSFALIISFLNLFKNARLALNQTKWFCAAGHNCLVSIKKLGFTLILIKSALDWMTLPVASHKLWHQFAFLVGNYTWHPLFFHITSRHFSAPLILIVNVIGWQFFASCNLPLFELHGESSVFCLIPVKQTMQFLTKITSMTVSKQKKLVANNFLPFVACSYYCPSCNFRFRGKLPIGDGNLRTLHKITEQGTRTWEFV